MVAVQRRNDEAVDIQGADVIRNGYQFLMEPIGGFAIWNGQWSLGGDPFPSGWQTYTSVGTAYWNRETNGVAGLYCARGGAVAMAVGPTICTLRYMPVDEDVNYGIECIARGKTVNSQYSMGALCFDSAKAYLGTAWALANDTPGVAYVRESKTIGPTGDVAWIANTQYARPCWALQDDATLTDEWIEIDDCQFHRAVAAGGTAVTTYRADSNTNQGFPLQAWVDYATAMQDVNVIAGDVVVLQITARFNIDLARTNGAYFRANIGGTFGQAPKLGNSAYGETVAVQFRRVSAGIATWKCRLQVYCITAGRTITTQAVELLATRYRG